MEIKIKSLKFDADQKLIAYVGKKVSRLARFYGDSDTAEVTLSLLSDPDNKSVKIRVLAPGGDFVIERSSKSFEDAVSAAVDAMKEKLTRAKEKRNEA
ncbi:MAG: HPF/RaiA family ribosome-associated protein [Bacteroidales bacterium]|nr:HPF/RaiA family ribosome-associated protein [Bacteroidales bacterium]